jgi:hypothetical protein
MRSKKFAVFTAAVFTMGLCVTASASNTSKHSYMRLAAQHEENKSAERSENKSDEQRAAELKREEIDLEKQAEAKHQQAKALIQKEKALRGQEVAHEHAEKGDKDKKDVRVLNGEEKQEGGEREQLSKQAGELEKEREALMHQAGEKGAERKALEAKIREREHKK